MSRYLLLVCQRVFSQPILRTLPLLLVLFASGARAQLTTPSVQAGQHLPVVSITLTRFGVFPKSASIPAQPFFLFILNHSGVLEDTFSLVPSAAVGGNPGAALLSLYSTLTRHRTSQLIQLLPGSYQVTFAAHPGWAFNLTVTPAQGAAQ